MSGHAALFAIQNGAHGMTLGVPHLCGLLQCPNASRLKAGLQTNQLRGITGRGRHEAYELSQTRITRIVTNRFGNFVSKFVCISERSRWDRRHGRQSRDGKRRTSREASEFQIRVSQRQMIGGAHRSDAPYPAARLISSKDAGFSNAEVSPSFLPR